MGKTNKHCLAN